TPAAAPPEAAQPAEELPDWLKGIAEETPTAAQPAEETPTVTQAATELHVTEASAEIPAWLKTAPVESELDETAVWLRSLEAPSHLPEVEPAMKGIEPLSEEATPPLAPPPSLDWKPVEVTPPPSITVPSHPKRTGSLSPTRDLHLAQAQMALERGDIRQAVEHYSRLIRKGRLLDEVIFDLREALYRYPVDVLLWQTLGDAYMRANRLREALDAYTKAEQLLR
ncbi:MAG: tetratricopeptide repeat protein, partial [Anaerolineales bacterium]